MVEANGITVGCWDGAKEAEESAPDAVGGVWVGATIVLTGARVGMAVTTAFLVREATAPKE